MGNRSYLIRSITLCTAYLLIFGPINTIACSCITPATDPFSEAKHIYVGSLIEAPQPIDDHEDAPLQAQMLVEYTVKGEALATLDIVTNAKASYCGIPLLKNRTYIVFIDESNDIRAPIEISICDPSGPITARYREHLESMGFHLNQDQKTVRQ